MSTRTITDRSAAVNLARNVQAGSTLSRDGELRLAQAVLDMDTALHEQAAPGPNFNQEANLHADTIAERLDATHQTAAQEQPSQQDVVQVNAWPVSFIEFLTNADDAAMRRIRLAAADRLRKLPELEAMVAKAMEHPGVEAARQLQSRYERPAVPPGFVLVPEGFLLTVQYELAWAGAHPDFSPGGPYREGWLKGPGELQVAVSAMLAARPKEKG